MLSNLLILIYLFLNYYAEFMIKSTESLIQTTLNFPGKIQEICFYQKGNFFINYWL